MSVESTDNNTVNHLPLASAGTGPESDSGGPALAVVSWQQDWKTGFYLEVQYMEACLNRANPICVEFL